MSFFKQKNFYIRFLMYLFLTTAVSYGGDAFLENVTLINWITFFSFFLLIIVAPLTLSVGNKKVTMIVLSFFILMFMAGKVEEWIKEYTPSVGYYNQSPCEYGVYEQQGYIKPFMDENITGLFYDYYMHFLLISTKSKLFLLSYGAVRDSYPNMKDNIFKWQDEINIKNLNLYQIAYINDKVLLLDNNKIMHTYGYFRDRIKERFLFTQVENEALDKYITRDNNDSYTKRLIYGKESKLFKEKYDCGDTGNSGIIIDKNNKSIIICRKWLKYKTTYLKYTPKIATHIADSDTILIAFEEKKGLYVFRNKYTNIFNKIQEEVTEFLKIINQPKWDKPDLTKLGYEPKKLKKLIDIFKPYEKNQYHSVEYKVVDYDGLQAQVKVDIDTEFTLFFYLSKEKENWNIKEIE